MRSPYSAFSRTFDGSGGVATELETDVMRFMAILALCLVAIFALVQSLPLAPSPAVDTGMPAPRAVVPTGKEVAATQESKPEPAAVVPTEKSTTRRTPAPAEPAATPVTTSTAAKGLVLQFESDHALARLVEHDAVGLYAHSAGGSHRLGVASGRMSFHPAPLPQAFHEMDPATVPVQVRRALAAAGVTDPSVRWGVTLPAAMSAELGRLLRVAEGGILVIDARGELRLEP